jgi:hypothetical protein
VTGGTVIPKAIDEVDKRAVYECDGWVCDLDDTGVSSTFRVILSGAALARMLPTLDLTGKLRDLHASIVVYFESTRLGLQRPQRKLLFRKHPLKGFKSFWLVIQTTLFSTYWEEQNLCPNVSNLYTFPSLWIERGAINSEKFIFGFFWDILRKFSFHKGTDEQGDEGQCARTLIMFETRTVRSERS